MKKALNQIWNMLKNIILFLLAKFIMIEAFVIGLVYSLFKAFYKRKIGISLNFEKDLEEKSASFEPAIDLKENLKPPRLK